MEGTRYSAVRRGVRQRARRRRAEYLTVRAAPRPIPGGALHRTPSRRRRPLRLALAVLAPAAAALAAAPLLAHDLFVVPERFALPAGRPLRVALVNGTFALSENVVARERVRSIRWGVGDSTLDAAPAGWLERGETTFVDLPAPPAGTIALGVSLHPATIALAGEDFDAYLVEEGLEDARRERERLGIAADTARERYAKHAKAVLRVGDGGGAGWRAILGFPAELVPLDDPTRLAPGDTLHVRAMSGGLPAVGVTLHAAWRGATGPVRRAPSVRADSLGIAALPIAAAGRWYLKTIDLRRATEPGLDYESEWATLTFEVGAGR